MFGAISMGTNHGTVANLPILAYYATELPSSTATECKNRDGLLRENLCARAVDNVRSVAFAAMAVIVAYIIARKRLIRLTALEQSAQLFIAVLALTPMLGYMLENMLQNIYYAIQRERKI